MLNKFCRFLERNPWACLVIIGLCLAFVGTLEVPPLPN